MKTITTRFRLLAILLLCLPSTIKASIQHTESFITSDLTISPDTINGEVFFDVSFDGLDIQGNPGEPALPVKYITFSVPYDAYNISVSVTYGNTLTYNLPSSVLPIQETPFFSGSGTSSYTAPKDSIYNLTNIYPTSAAKITSEGFYNGENHIVTIAVTPVRYTPSLNKLSFHRNISITINYDCGDGLGPLAIKPLLKYNTTTRDKAFEHVKSIVKNPTQVEGFVAPLAISTFTVEPLPYYEYCVITSRELAPAFERLVAWQLHKGFDAGIVCMEDILACEEYQNGDPISGINNDAGKLRAYLMDASAKGGARYVLLGGKEPHVPVMKGHYFYATDLYFADLNGDWDYNKDGKYYGHYNFDKVDFATDIKVGRLLCKNIAEVENYVDKYLTYERNPPTGSEYYNHRFAHFQGSLYDNYSQDFSRVIESMHISQVPFETHYSNNSMLGSEVIGLLNNTKSNMMFMNGHGNEGGIMVSDNGINALDNERHWIPDELGNGLDNLQNKLYPSIMFAMSCQTIPYEKTDSAFSLNVGESFTLGKNYGGVAYIGFNETILVSEGCKFEAYFMKTIDQYSNIYDAFSESRRMYENGGFSRYAYNLLGDPTIQIRLNTPNFYNHSNFEVIRDAGDLIQFSVLNIPIEEEYCLAFRQPDGTSVRETVVSAACSGISSNSSIMVYNENMVPYIAPLVVQNQTYNKSLYIFASSVYMGNNVNANCEPGDVVIASGIDIVLDASEEVVLGPGFIINSNASLTIKSQGKVTLSGCTVKTGATLKIEAAELEVSTDFNLQQNANMEFSKISL